MSGSRGGCALLILGLLASGCGSSSPAADQDATPAQGSCECGDDEICVTERCIPASCDNLALDGIESDIDCGGNCSPCTEGQVCRSAGDCKSRFCDGDTCRDCQTDDDCAAVEGTTCIAGICALPGGLGDVCSDDGDCESGHCADGVCCSEACDDTCRSCRAADTAQEVDGVCDFVHADTDPGGDCTPAGPRSCGPTGACDGAGACVLASSNTICAEQTCVEGEHYSTVTQPRNCDGAGSCEPGIQQSCLRGHACEDDNSCNVYCSQPDDCLFGYVCVDGYCCDGGPAQCSELEPL